MIHLLAIATNYTGESYELPDCELDARNVVAAFKPHCDSVKSLIGSKATRAGITKAVRALIGSLKKGDLGLLYFSGHGTYETIKGKRVEAIVCHGGTLIYDFETRIEFNKRVEGSLIAAASDSCYSGGMLRDFKLKPRTVNVHKLRTHKVDMPTRTPERPDAKLAASNTGEYSYSTGNGGAYTNVFLMEFKKSKFNTTIPSWHKRIRKHLPSDQWPQTPQLQIDDVLKRRTLKSFKGTA